MNDVLKPAIQDHIADQINQLFGVPAKQPSLFQRMLDSAHSEVNAIEGHPSTDQKQAPLVQHSAKTGAYRYSTDGGQTWQPGQPPSQ